MADDVLDDIRDEIIACSLDGEIDDPDEWLDRHEEQAGESLTPDDVDVSGADATCVSYDPAVDLEITATEGRPSAEMAEPLRNRLLTGTFAGVTLPARTGCDRVWADSTDLPLFDGEIPGGPGRNYYMAFTTICADPREFLRLQYIMGTRSDDPDEEGFRVWLRDVVDERVDEIRESIDAGDREWPRPFLYLDENADLVSYQEGRHRGVAAVQAGVEEMDLYVFASADTNRGRPPYKWETPPAFPDGAV